MSETTWPRHTREALASATPGGARGSRWKVRLAACLAVIATAQAAAADATTTTGHEVRVRKSVTSLSAQERADFVEAVLALKATPSPFDPQLSYFDQFAAWHLALFPCQLGHDPMRPHAGPMFLPWHRLFLLVFEDALREVSGKPIAVPYWDWTDPTSIASVFADDFMGGDGDPDQDFAVTTGPFRKGEWTLNVHPIGMEWAPSATTYLTRRFGTFPPAMSYLPTAEDVAWAMGRPSYDVAPYDAGADVELSLRNALEGFWRHVGPARLATGSHSMACGPDGVMAILSGEGMHNSVHAWVGGMLEVTPRGPRLGTMMVPTSPNDPVFFLHHANIDRLWAEWQDAHGVDTYEPVTCAGTPLERCTDNTASDPMHPPFEATPADVADARELGYRYETQDGSTLTAAASPPARAAWVTDRTAYRCDVPEPVR